MVPPMCKESPRCTSRYHNIMGHFLGVPTLILPMGIFRESVGFDHWESEKGREAYNNQHLEIDRLSFYLQHPSSSLHQQLCSSAESRWWCSLNRELSMAQVCMIQVLKRALSTLKSRLPLPRKGNSVLAWPISNCSSCLA
uniref:Uncharacterized protein n=1 Tax=Molossus molossus TaxID=27622 RepID=A0A7J8J7N0_MOLMO|nr:hypothetical protein HJG59_009573 [Molossus molossus]